MKKSPLIQRARGHLILGAETAADLMTPDVQGVPDTMSVKEAAAFLTTRGFSAAPVVADAGQQVGVVSRSDIVRHDYEKVEHVREVPERPIRNRLTARWGERLPAGYHVEAFDDTPVRDIMTPVVYSVQPQTPATTVVDAML